MTLFLAFRQLTGNTQVLPSWHLWVNELWRAGCTFKPLPAKEERAKIAEEPTSRQAPCSAGARSKWERSHTPEGLWEPVRLTMNSVYFSRACLEILALMKRFQCAACESNISHATARLSIRLSKYGSSLLILVLEEKCAAWSSSSIIKDDLCFE